MSKLKYKRIIKGTDKLGVLPFPPPWQAWLTVSNDPDHTTLENWKELDNFIWKELKLPWADSLFIDSDNHHLPKQVCLTKNPDIHQLHPYDTIHTWGDYIFSKKHYFDRENILNNIKILKASGLKPLIWTDHSFFLGNLRHSSNLGSMKNIKDNSGQVYKNDLYSLDLIRQIGIHYIWDGKINRFLGQDIKISAYQQYKEINKSVVKSVLLAGANKLFYGLFKKLYGQESDRKDNRQYYLYRFPDGQKFYCFTRYGHWKKAEIDGLAELISPEKIKKLIRRQGTCIVYTHLGKRRAERNQDYKHLLNNTKTNLKFLNGEFCKQKILLSSTAKLLDYLIIRDNIEINSTTKEFNFWADGIRFKKIDTSVLQKFSFGLGLKNPEDIKILIDGQPAKFQIEKIYKNYYRLNFK